MTQVKNLVIVGGVAGGASAAARARRLSEDANIIMFERGEHITFANCGLPYHIGGDIQDRDSLLVMTPESFRDRFNVEVKNHHEVTVIDRKKNEVSAKNLLTGEEANYPYDALVLSPGAEPVRPPLPGIDLPGIYTLRNIADMDAIKAIIDENKPQRAVIVGGGYIGLEMCEALRERGVWVTLVEMMNQVMGPCCPELAAVLHTHLRNKGIALELSKTVKAFYNKEDKLDVELSTGEHLPAEMVILAIGVKPEVKLAREAGLAIGSLGGIEVDTHMRTNDPDIYAVGDAIEVSEFVTGEKALIPLAGPANRQGRIVADNIFGRPSEYKRTQATAICKVFDLTIGMTGINEKRLKNLGWKYEAVHLHPMSHAGYYPGACPIHFKLLFDPDNGRIYGAQAVGVDGVDKRIDIMAVAIRAGLTVFDLEEMELSYAPPYGSAKDPINYAGFIAANIIRGDVQISHARDFIKADHDQFLLDVRNDDEVAETDLMPGAAHIPLPQLRRRLDELPRDKTIHICCKVGLRGYVACRILSQKGFACTNISGGYLTYLATIGKPIIACEPATSSDAGEMGPVKK